MSQLEKRRSRYLQDSIPPRLGGLAANLARVASFSKHDGHQEVVLATIQESKWFIEWTANDLRVEQTAELVRLQSQVLSVIFGHATTAKKKRGARCPAYAHTRQPGLM